MGRELSEADNISSLPPSVSSLIFLFFPCLLGLYIPPSLYSSTCFVNSWFQSVLQLPHQTHTQGGTQLMRSFHGQNPAVSGNCSGYLILLLGVVWSENSPWALTCSSESKRAKNNKWINLRAVSSSNKTHPREIIKNNNCFFSLAPSLFSNSSSCKTGWSRGENYPSSLPVYLPNNIYHIVSVIPNLIM